MIVTKDSDFDNLAVIHGSTPKVIWIRLGNCTTASIEILLRTCADRIEAFEQGADSILLLP